MTIFLKKRKITGLALLISIFAVASPSYASDTSDTNETQARMEALSYAPTSSFDESRFSQFELESSEYGEHELNDAWLGMPAYSSDGKLVGYIEDAFIDNEGYVSEVVVGLNGTEVALEIDAEFAELTDELVKFEISQRKFAELANGNQLASAN